MTRQNQSSSSTCECDDPTEGLGCLFVDTVQQGRIDEGQTPAKRPVFLRLHGVAYGRLEVRNDLPQELAVGLFANCGNGYDAWVRFSSDIPDGEPDYQSTCGIGIKLFGVPGEKPLGPQTDATTADILMQNFPVFFVDNAKEMCNFTRASLDGTGDDWLADHPRTDRILKEMAQEVPTVLGIDYWSVIPFRLGENHYCKYKLEPECPPHPGRSDYDDPTYLEKDLHHRLQQCEARFKLLIQVQTNDEQMPLDQATVPWSETDSPPVHAATLILPVQDTHNRGQAEYGEQLAFNPWRVPEANVPVGSIADVRKVVYQQSADLRRNVNGQTVGEPREPRPAETYPATRDTHIVRAAIHPAIGVARIGNSPDGYYIGPEVADPGPTVDGQHRDANGAIQRQAARFRIYGYNAAGEVVGELGAGDADIRWTVHVANRKAAWYRFAKALDIPSAQGSKTPRRNPNITGDARETLVIDPGPRSISGADAQGPEYAFDSGTFLGTKVYLGELRTDCEGRLLFLGGRGVSASPSDAPIYDPSDPGSFNNADGWYDDTSDGSVHAEVSIDGRAIPVDGAWVVTAPPNFAPDVIGWRTLHDMLTDCYVEAGRLPYPETISFTRDVYPVLQRMTGLQWVNKGFDAMFGYDGPLNLEDAGTVRKLADPGTTYEALRRTVLNVYRGETVKGPNRGPWPWIYGDAFENEPDPTSPRVNLMLPNVKYRILKQWVDGDFVNDWNPNATLPKRIEDLPLEAQPDALDRAALHYCLADAFHPGCELTWPMRHNSLYRAPFRIREKRDGVAPNDYGADLTPEIALRVDGPLYEQSPGDLTRWMAMPWQTDTAFCRSGYDHEYDPYVPTYWPARVPNQVLTVEDYAVVMDQNRPREERLAAFHRRADWLRGLPIDPIEAMLHMVKHFDGQGIIEARPGLPDDPDFPPMIWVEDLPGDCATSADKQTAKARLEAKHKPGSLSEAGWESEAHCEAFRRVKRWNA